MRAEESFPAFSASGSRLGGTSAAPRENGGRLDIGCKIAPGIVAIHVTAVCPQSALRDVINFPHVRDIRGLAVLAVELKLFLVDLLIVRLLILPRPLYTSTAKQVFRNTAFPVFFCTFFLSLSWAAPVRRFHHCTKIRDGPAFPCCGGRAIFRDL